VIKELEEKYEEKSWELRLQKGLTEQVQLDLHNNSFLNESLVSDVHVKVDKLLKSVEEKDSKIGDLEKVVLNLTEQMKFMKFDMQKNEGARA